MRFCSHCGTELPSRPPVTCPVCRTGHWRNAKPCAGALATRDGELLLIRRNHEPWFGRWDIPGGFCEVEEHPIETAERELHEETGFEVEVTGFLGAWLDDYPDPDVEPEDTPVTLNLYYHARVVGGAEDVDPLEVTEIGWFAPRHLPAEMSFPRHSTRVLEAWRGEFEAGRTTGPLPDHPER